MTTIRAARRNAERWASNQAAVAEAEVAVDKEPKRDGLEWLRRKDHISNAEYEAGLWYAACYRWAHMESAVPIPSFLERQGVGGSGVGAPEDLAVAARIAAARQAFDAIELRVGWDSDMQLALLFVCVHGRRFSDAGLNYGETCMTIGEFKKTLGHIAQVKAERSRGERKAA